MNVGLGTDVATISPGPGLGDRLYHLEIYRHTDTGTHHAVVDTLLE